MTDQDPARLKSRGETPAELVNALQALGRDRDAARLARVAQRLGSSLANGPSATSWLRSASGAKLLTGLVIGAGAAGLIGYALLSAKVQDEQATQPSARSAEAAAHPLAPPGPGPTADARAPSAAPMAADPRDLGSASVPTRSSVPAPVRTSDRKDRGRGGDASTSEFGPAAPPRPRTKALSSSPPTGVARTPTSPAAPRPARPSAPEPQPVPPRPTREPVELPAQRQAPSRPSEVALLHQARRLAVGDPQRALTVLNEHAERFPNGLLVPERELLVIEVLRRLDRNAEADQRVRRFEARYPGSLHLRRLERAGSTADDR
jgi:hypothetical protein